MSCPRKKKSAPTAAPIAGLILEDPECCCDAESLFGKVHVAVIHVHAHGATRIVVQTVVEVFAAIVVDDIVADYLPGLRLLRIGAAHALVIGRRVAVMFDYVGADDCLAAIDDRGFRHHRLATNFGARTVFGPRFVPALLARRWWLVDGGDYPVDTLHAGEIEIRIAAGIRECRAGHADSQNRNDGVGNTFHDKPPWGSRLPLLNGDSNLAPR